MPVYLQGEKGSAMLNWVYNEVIVAGVKSDLIEVRNQLNTPFEVTHDSYANGALAKETYFYSKPVFSFWNIIRPLNLDLYNDQPDTSSNFPVSWDELSEQLEEAVRVKQDWYHWNLRNWGVKWDVALANNEDSRSTEMTKDVSSDDDGIDFISYQFETAWSPPEMAIAKLAEQYPTLSFDLVYKEETGWGGRTRYQFNTKTGAVEATIIETYIYKCSHCHYFTGDQAELENSLCEAECEEIACPKCKNCSCSEPELAILDPFLNPGDLSETDGS